MDFTLVDPIARTILYEGYLLYPYRTSSLKNRQPCAFGSLVPKAYSLANGESEAWTMQTECLIRGDDRTTLQGVVRFLHPGGKDGPSVFAQRRTSFLAALPDHAHMRAGPQMHILPLKSGQLRQT